MTITLLAHHIEWDADGDIDAARALPSKVVVEVDLNDVTHSTNINDIVCDQLSDCLLYTSPSPRDYAASRMPSSA